MILVFGTICLDRVRNVPRLPPPGGYVEVSEEQYCLGGEAANTSVALQAWGAKFKLAGNSFGEGYFGELLAERAKQKDLPIADLIPGSQKTPICDVYVTPDGERTMFGVGFATAGTELELSHVPFGGATWFTADPNFTESAWAAAGIAQSKGCRLYLMDFFDTDTHTVPEGAFWQSSTDWVGFHGNTQKNVAWLRQFVQHHGVFGVLSDGPNGLIAGGNGHPVRAYPPFPCPSMVDSTGAGDMFRAGMLYGLDQGWEISRCIQFASSAGCLKCAGLGATSFVPSLEAIEGHIRANPEVAVHYT